MPDTGQNKNKKAPKSSTVTMQTRSKSRLSSTPTPPMQEMDTSHSLTPAEATRTMRADTSLACHPTSSGLTLNSPTLQIISMLEQVLVKLNPLRQVKTAIEEILAVAKKAAVMEKGIQMHDPLSTVKVLHDSLKTDLLSVQNNLEAKISELKNDHLKLISTTDTISRSTECLKSTTCEIECKVVKYSDSTDKLANTTLSYCDAILANPNSSNRSSTDPKVLDGMDKKARQVLVGFELSLDNPTIRTCLIELKDKANGIISSLAEPARPKEVFVVDIHRTRDHSILLLFNSKEAADWIREADVEDKFLDKFANGASIKSRKFNVLMRCR